MPEQRGLEHETRASSGIDTRQRRFARAIILRVTITQAYQSTLPMLTGTIGTLVGLVPMFWLVSTALLAGAWSVRHKWHRLPGGWSGNGRRWLQANQRRISAHECSQ